MHKINFNFLLNDLRCLAGHMAMHACQIGLTDTAPPCPGSPLRACVGTKGGTLCGRQPFCPHFSSATQVCGRCDYTLPSFRDWSGSWDLRPRWWIGCRMSPKWTGLDRLLLPLLGCWCQKQEGWRGLALGAGWWRLWAAPALAPSCGALSERQKWPPGPILLRFSA